MKIGQELDRKLFVLKDINPLLNDYNVISQLKGIANKINEGLDATIIIVSSILKYQQYRDNIDVKTKLKDGNY